MFQFFDVNYESSKIWAGECDREGVSVGAGDSDLASFLGLPEGAVTGMQVEKGQWHRLESLESGTVIVEMKDGAYEPIGEEDVLSR